MTALSSRRPRLAPLAAIAGVVAIVVTSQVVGIRPFAGSVGLDEPLLAAPPAADRDAAVAEPVAAVADPAAAPSTGVGRSITAGVPNLTAPHVTVPAPATAPGGAATDAFDPGAELARIRADVDFWAARLTAHPADIVAAVKLAESDVAEARMTGDVTAYLRAEKATDVALEAHPRYVPAQAMRATILVALHRFPQARDLAYQILAAAPGDSTALGALGDASLELGDLDTAAPAYGELHAVADGSASRIRAGRLAFVTGDTVTAVAQDRAAVAAALDEGLEGDALAFYHVTLGEMLLATGDAQGARDAYAAALAARPGLPAALVGMAKLDGFDGRLDAAIGELGDAIDAIPLPDSLARRADLLTLRAGSGDSAQAASDQATIEAIARLAGEAGSVYDRGLSLYLSDHGRQPERAVALARDELAVRPDVYGYDALAWALLNAGDAAGAQAPMRSALAAGTRDARLWYHAGLIAAANGRGPEAADFLRDALALGPALDPVARARAQSALESVR
jgi:hypothetical protein